MKAAIQCKGCKTENAPDSKFCKACGAKVELPRDLKPEDAEALLKDGFELVADGHAQEALFLAESILDTNPDNASAYALKAMCHEEKGEISSAIAAQENVVRLNPHSTLDRIKLGQLRKREEAPPEDLETKDRNWIAIFSAAAATIAVAVLGIALAQNNVKAAEPKKPTLLASNLPPGAEPFKAPASTQPQAPATTQPQPAATHPPVVTNPLPGATGPLSLDIRPIRSGLPNVGGSAKPAPIGTDNSNPTAPKPDNNIIEPKERPNPGRIVIEETKGHPSDPSVSDNIYRVAQQKMAGGDYRGAIRDFGIALQGSRKPGLIHQLMGRCFARIGDGGNAKQHFEQALQIYTSLGNENEAKACRRELELLAG